MATVADQVKTYLAKQPPGVRRTLVMMRKTIKAAAPAAAEVFSYGIPGFRLDRQPLLWYAGWTEHTSLYPVGPEIRKTLGPAAARYKGAKGTIRFPIDDPPSAALVTRIVKARLRDVRTRAR